MDISQQAHNGKPNSPQTASIKLTPIYATPTLYARLLKCSKVKGLKETEMQKTALEEYLTRFEQQLLIK